MLAGFIFRNYTVAPFLTAKLQRMPRFLGDFGFLAVQIRKSEFYRPVGFATNHQAT
jgi:hypothetical protein